ncbi:hypothetical protein [Halomonas sp. LBP4]|uniref:hypothetical protein n=1 Tax=Halomonas sp. LBP4 TaxID=2044917 RepID=UPI000D754447|nr:hypothetical protein [Halomonas sp. LBP4]PXX99289.1 hypothetical protein CR157_00380 [Halomonas sp. LBP4]
MAIDKDLARSLLTSAVTRYESACRWGLVTVLVMLVFHVMTFGPFVAAQVERAKVAAESKALKQTSDELRANLRAQQTAMQEVRDGLDVMLVRKKADLDALQRAVEFIRESTSGEQDEAGSERGANLAVQAPIAVQEPAPRLQDSARVRFFAKRIEQEGLSERVRAASTGADLRTILTPLIDRHVIAPQFARVNENWQSKVPQLETGALRIKEQFAKLANTFPNAPLWAEMREKADSYLDDLRAVEFGPPDDPQWWHTVVGKDDAVLQMKELEVALISPPSFHAANEALQNWLSDRDTMLAGLNAQLQSLQQRFDEQQDRLANLLVPISGVALDLSIVVGNFPLVLAILLGSAIGWPARRHRELLRAVALARRADLITRGDEDLLTAQSSAWPLGYALGSVALSIAWISVVSWQLAKWTDRGDLDLVSMTAVAITFVVAAGIYKFRIAKQGAGHGFSRQS